MSRNSGSGNGQFVAKKFGSEEEEKDARNPLKRKRDTPKDSAEDSKLKEFLGVMQRPSQSKSWQNEAVDGMEDVPVVEQEKMEVESEGESGDEYQTISKKSKTGRTGNENVLPSDTSREHVSVLPEPAGESGREQAPDAPAEGQSDADWLRSKTSRLLGFVNEEEERPQPTQEPEGEDAEREVFEKVPSQRKSKDTPTGEEDAGEMKTEIDENEKDIRDSQRLFLRNLSYTITEDDVMEHFADFGVLEEVRLVLFSFHSNFMMIN